jgi:hypothetical protein
MLFISGTLSQICLFEFIRVEGGVKFMEHFKGAQAIKVWEPLSCTERYCSVGNVGSAACVHFACIGPVQGVLTPLLVSSSMLSVTQVFHNFAVLWKSHCPLEC